MPVRGRWWKVLLFTVYALLILEVGCRVFWRIERRVPFFGSTPYHWYAGHFGGLRAAAIARPLPRRSDANFDVLLLGGSVLDNLHERRGQELARRLEEVSGQPVLFHDFARSAHTSRDSLLKYRLLEDGRYDLVIFYHGINDARMNNVPPERFRADYTHVSWFAVLRVLEEERPWDAWFVLPFTLHHAWVDLMGLEVFRRYAPRGTPTGEWTRYGADVKSAASFRANLGEILDLAARRGDPVLVATFAWYVPPDYSLARFQAKSLDYGSHAYPIEIWGRPDNVVAALRAHNAVIRELARRPGTLFVDLAREIGPGAANFDDICHLGDAGEEIWIDRVVAEVARNTAGGRALRPPEPAAASPAPGGALP